MRVSSHNTSSTSERSPNRPSSIVVILALSVIGFVSYQLFNTMSTSGQGSTSAAKGRYGNNHLSGWSPKPFVPPDDSVSRSPCPMLNTLANHGYLPRDGRNITRSTLVDVLQQMGLSEAISNGLADAAKLVGRPATTDDQANNSGKKTEFIFDLEDLGKHGPIEHDISFTRFDYRPSEDPKRHIRASNTLIDQLKSFADKDGFLDARAAARARNLRQSQSRAEAKAANDPNSAKFGPRAQLIAHAECAALLEVIGRNGRVHVDDIEAFMRREQFTDGWAPPSKPIGVPTLLATTTRCALYRYAPGNWNPKQGASTETDKDNRVIQKNSRHKKRHEHAEL